MPFNVMFFKIPVSLLCHKELQDYDDVYDDSLLRFAERSTLGSARCGVKRLYGTLGTH